MREEIVAMANNSSGFAIIADESADISGKEQLSIGVRFVSTSNEEFLGFTKLDKMDASSIADSILDQCSKFGLNLEKLHGQGYDGCSTMAGKEGGVQAKIRNKYSKAVFVHCASHRLNLVVNDLNAVPEIRNTIGTVRDCYIVYFIRSGRVYIWL